MQVSVSAPLLYTLSPGTPVTFFGAIIDLSQNAGGSADQIQFSFPNGYAAEPLWGAGNTNVNPLPSPPVSVAQMAGSAFYAVGTAVVISDPLLPVQVTNANQVLTFQNGLPVTALGPLPLNSLLGGIVQAIIAFQGVTTMQQITGSPATANLAVNQMNVPTGTLAPLSIVPMMAGLAFVSPEGLRIIDFLARVGDPVGDAGKGVAIPFVYALHPSRICAAATADVLRISVQNNTPAALMLAPPPTAPPFQEYWFDLTRKVWSGPHTFPASLIQAWRNTFVMTPIGVLGSVWQSDPKPMAGSLFVENGVPMPFAWTTVLLPDNELMAENFMVETMLAFAMAPTQEITITAVNDLGLTLGTVILAANPSLFGQAVAGQAQFGGGNILAQYPIPWADGLHFKQMRLQAVGTLSYGDQCRRKPLHALSDSLGYPDRKMMKKLYLLLALLAVVLVPGIARAATCPSFPYIFTNGVTIDANQLMANLNLLLSCVQGNQPPSPPTTVYVKLGGTATGASCFSPATPCGTIVPDAVNAAATVVQGINPVVISVADSGPYLGGVIAYASTGRGALTTSTRAFPWLEIIGTAAPVVIQENPAEPSCVICVPAYTSLYFNNVTLQKKTGTTFSGFDILGYGMSNIRLTNVNIDNATSNVNVESMIDAASISSIEFSGSLTVNGGTALMAEAEDLAILIFDSGTTIVCGPNFSYTQAFFYINHSIINQEADPDPVTYSGCPTSGVAMQAVAGSQWKRDNATGDVLAGNVYRFDSASTVAPAFYVPSLGACVNGTLRGGSSNYKLEIEFSGPSTSCIVNFGKPASFTSYWLSEPSCTASSNNVAALETGRTINTVGVFGSFINDTEIFIHCDPFNGG